MKQDEMEGVIAVIGMSGRFPGADNIQKFWQNLCAGLESISEFSIDELEAVNLSDINRQNYVKSRGILDNVEYFDANFFGFSPKEAQITDPQHRLFLECAWEALENAGYCTDQYSGLIGVYGGMGMSSYFLNHLYPNKQLQETVGEYLLHIGNDKDFLTTRVSYKMNLKGPSLAIQTACSTSLVAICVACNHLLSYQCDMALAGAASIVLPQKSGYHYQEGMIFSPDGRCKPFDADAKGTVPGNGVGIVVLKRLEDAFADRDHIYAVIRGYGINNDGFRKVGYSAPSIQGQAEAITSAISMAGFNPETITYAEAHGTGTLIGDPIEIEAITQSFRSFTLKKEYCALGALKSNIGHLIEAAGVASLIKTVLALQHHLLPPSLHFNRPNPHIDFANSPFYLNTKLCEWKSTEVPRRACVSSFGIGGTNAFAILEEFSGKILTSQSRSSQLIILSAKTPTALKAMADNFGQYLQSRPSLPLADVAYTLQVGRKAFEHKQAFISFTTEEAASQLLQYKPESLDKPVTQRKIIFMLPGQGSEYVYMGHQLYQNEPCYRHWIDTCAILLRQLIMMDLREILYPAPNKIQVSSELLKQEINANAALFVTEYALAKLLEEWGIMPHELIGCGSGEYVAACLAEVFTLEDGLELMIKQTPLRKIQLSSPKIPFISNCTNTWIRSEQAVSLDYWIQQRQCRLHYPTCMRELLKETNKILVEVGPESTLYDAAKCHLSCNSTNADIPSLSGINKHQSDTEVLLTALGQLWCSDVKINWKGFYKHERRHRVPLPTYPFERERFWIDPPPLQIKTIELESAYLPTKENIETTLIDIWKECLGMESIGLHDDFFSLGGDSILAIQIISKIQTIFGVSLNINILLEASTISELKIILSQKIAMQSNNRGRNLPSMIVNLKKGNSKKPFFLIHPIGGEVFCYKPLIECMRYDGPCYGIQADESSREISNLYTIEDIASYYLKSIRQVQNQGPYQLLGFSFGGLIAYEIARQLHEANQEIGLLTMLDIIRPNHSSQNAVKKDIDMLALLIELFGGKEISKNDLDKLSEKDQVEKLMKAMELHALPFDRQEKIFKQVKRHCKALMHYQPKPYQGKIVFFQAKERFFRTSAISNGETWTELAQDGIDLYEMPGNHVSMIKLSQTKEIADLLDEYLNKSKKA